MMRKIGNIAKQKLIKSSKPCLPPKEKTRIVMRSFIMSQFSYCPLIWMFHDRHISAKINQIHERALRIAYQDHTSSFEELLITDKSVSVHQRNLQLLVTEIYRTKMN